MGACAGVSGGNADAAATRVGGAGGGGGNVAASGFGTIAVTALLTSVAAATGAWAAAVTAMLAGDVFSAKAVPNRKPP